jgi:hypothetical protein
MALFIPLHGTLCDPPFSPKVPRKLSDKMSDGSTIRRYPTGSMCMKVFPFPTHEAVHLDGRLSKMKLSAILDADRGEQREVVQISTEAKKRQILDRARTEVLERIRNT